MTMPIDEEREGLLPGAAIREPFVLRRGLFSRVAALPLVRRFIPRDPAHWNPCVRPSKNWSSARGSYDPDAPYAGKKPPPQPPAPTEALPEVPSEQLAPELIEVLSARFAELKPKPARREPAIEVPAESLVPVLTFLRDEARPPFAWPQQVTAVDRPETNQIEVVYVLRRVTDGSAVCVHVCLEREHPVMPSAAPLFQSFEWHEREVNELFGVTFAGHPDPRKLLLDSTYPGFPLRKDYTDDEHELVQRPG